MAEIAISSYRARKGRWGCFRFELDVRQMVVKLDAGGEQNFPMGSTRRWYTEKYDLDSHEGHPS